MSVADGVLAAMGLTESAGTTQIGKITGALFVALGTPKRASGCRPSLYRAVICLGAIGRHLPDKRGPQRGGGPSRCLRQRSHRSGATDGFLCRRYHKARHCLPAAHNHL